MKHRETMRRIVDVARSGGSEALYGPDLRTIADSLERWLSDARDLIPQVGDCGPFNAWRAALEAYLQRVAAGDASPELIERLMECASMADRCEAVHSAITKRVLNHSPEVATR